MSARWRALRGLRPARSTLSRRSFLAGLGGLGAGLGLAAWWGAQQPDGVRLPFGESSAPWAGGLLAPTPLTPPSPSQRPATYWLQDAGERVFDSVLARLNPAAGYRPFFGLDLSGPEPVLHHDVWDWIDMTGRAVDGFARLRLMTGTDAGQVEEAAVRRLLLGQQGAQGLLWNGPAPGGSDYASNTVEIFSQSRGLLALSTWFAITGSARVEEALEAAVAGLDGIAVHEGNSARYPGTQWAGEWLDYTNTPEGAPEGRAKWGLGALVALPLLEYHALGGSRAARALADRLLGYFVDESGLVGSNGQFRGHVHAEGYAGLATAAVYQARLADRDDRLRWAERVYAYVRGRATRHGWIPDAMDLPEQHYWYWYHMPWLPPTCETCALADVIQLAIALAETAYPQYWDDVERFARNHLLASQFPPSAAFLPLGARDTPGARALAGSFASATLPNSLFGHLVTGCEPLVEGCCTGSGARALHLVWEHAVEDRADGLYVHLGFSADRKAAEVLGYEPYAGQREVRLRAPRRVLVRLPDYARRDEAELWVDGARRDPLWRGAYADAGYLDAGQVVVLRYPLPIQTEQVEVNRQLLTVQWQGGTVLAVSPEGAAPVPYRRAPLARAPLPWQSTPAYPRLATRLSPFA